jgi:hypothetical protein
MYRKSIVISMALSAVCLEAQHPAAPQVGVVHAPDGSLRAVYGLPANFIYGALLGKGVNAAAFSNTAGLVFRAGQIDYVSPVGAQIGVYSTNEPSPLLAVGPVSAGNQTASGTALAWLPSSKLLLIWSGGVPNQVGVAPLPGNVISLSPAAPGLADLIVSPAGGGLERLTISLGTGQVVETETLTADGSLAYEQNGFLLLPGNDGLQVRFPDGRQQLIGITTSAMQFEAISDEWVHLSTAGDGAAAGSHWLLHLDGTAQGEAPLGLSELPAVPGRVPRIMPRPVGNSMMRTAQ